MTQQFSQSIGMIAPFGIRPKGTLVARMLPLAQALSRRGHNVHIVAPPVHNPQDAGTTDVRGSVRITHTRLPRLPGLAGVLEQSALLLQALRREQTHIVHLFKPKGFGGLAALASQYLPDRVPLVVDTDDWEGAGGWNDLLPYPAAARALFAWQERDLPRRAAAVTVASRTLETQVWGFGVPPDRVFYVPNGVEPTPQAVSPRAERPTVLLYTRFWEFTVPDVVAMLVALLQHRPDAELLVVGKGERGEEAQLLALAERAGVQRAITYRGWMEPANLPPLLAGAHVAIVPMDDTLINRARGLAKLLELMALGLPIVASKVGQVQEYLEHGTSAILVPPHAPGAMALAVAQLLGAPDTARALGNAAHERAQRLFAWDVLATELESAYRRAIHSVQIND